MNEKLKEIAKEVGVKVGKLSEQALAKKVAAAIDKMKMKDWEKLDEVTQDWYNAAIEAMDAEKKIPMPEDADEEEGDDEEEEDEGDDEEEEGDDEEDDEEEEEDEGDDEDEDDDEEEGDEDEDDDEEEGDEDEDDDEEEEGDEEEGDEDEDDEEEEGDDEDEEDAPDYEQYKGKNVTVTKTNGTEYTGQCIKVGAESLTVETAKGKKRIAFENIEDIKGKRGRPATGGEGAKKGESATMQAKRAIAENPKATKEAILKKLKKAGVTINENTFGIQFNDMQRTMQVLQDQGWTPPKSKKSKK